MNARLADPEAPTPGRVGQVLPPVDLDPGDRARTTRAGLPGPRETG